MISALSTILATKGELICCYVAKILRETFLTYASEIYDIDFCFCKVAVTRCRKHLNQQFLPGSPPLDVSYFSSLSKQDLKQFSKNYLLGFARTYFSSLFATGGRLSYKAYNVNSAGLVLHINVKVQ